MSQPSAPSTVTPLNTIHIPSHIPSELDGVTRLLVARGWERAAVVWAYCKPGQGTRTSTENRGGRYAFQGFADLGFAGLRHHETVSRYWRIWNDAIKAGHVGAVKPGDTVPEPDMPWPGSREDNGTGSQLDEPEPDGDEAVARTAVDPNGRVIIVNFTEEEQSPAEPHYVTPSQEPWEITTGPSTPTTPSPESKDWSIEAVTTARGIARDVAKLAGYMKDESVRDSAKSEIDNFVNQSISVLQHSTSVLRGSPDCSRCFHPPQGAFWSTQRLWVWSGPRLMV